MAYIKILSHKIQEKIGQKLQEQEVDNTLSSQTGSLDSFIKYSSVSVWTVETFLCSYIIANKRGILFSRDDASHLGAYHLALHQQNAYIINCISKNLA